MSGSERFPITRRNRQYPRLSVLQCLFAHLKPNALMLSPAFSAPSSAGSAEGQTERRRWAGRAAPGCGAVWSLGWAESEDWAAKAASGAPAGRGSSAVEGEASPSDGERGEPVNGAGFRPPKPGFESRVDSNESIPKLPESARTGKSGVLSGD